MYLGQRAAKLTAGAAGGGLDWLKGPSEASQKGVNEGTEAREQKYLESTTQS